MRDRTMVVLAVGAITVALLAPMPSLNAMTLPAPSALTTAQDAVDAVERVRTVCAKEWDGYQWQDRCRTTRSHHYRHHYYSRSAQVRRMQRRIFYYLRHYW